MKILFLVILLVLLVPKIQAFGEDEGNVDIEIELLFNNDATIKLETEVVQAKLEDQGESWTVEEVNKKNDTQT